MASKTALKTREKGAGCIYKDGKRWYLKARINGKAKTKMLRNEDGTPCTTEKDAIAAADGYRKILFAEDRAEMALQIAEAKKLKRQSGLRLSEAWAAYLDEPNRPASAPATLKNHLGIFNRFLGWAASTRPDVVRVADVDEATADDYLVAVWKSGVSAKRYNDTILSLRLIFRHLMKTAALEINPFDHLQKKPQETASRREFTPEQVNAIFNGFETGFFYETEVEKLAAGRKRERVIERLQYHPMNAEEMRVLLNLCCWTGCRGQDGCLMEWRNIDLMRREISYIPHKTARKTNGRAVTLPIHPKLEAALYDALSWKDRNNPKEDFILPAVADRYRRNPSGIQKDVMKIIRCATGLETTASEAETRGRRKLAANAYSLHSFRHTFVSFCANAGVPLAVVAEIVGHGNPAMTRHYSHITTEAKRGAIEALPMFSRPLPLAEHVNEPAGLKSRIVALLDNAPAEVLQEVAEILERVK